MSEEFVTTRFLVSKEEQSLDNFINEWPEYSIDPPSKIKAYLDLHVVGQDRAKKILSVAFFNRELRKLSHDPRVQEIRGKCKLQKNNVLLIGPTGCGKTLLMKKLAEYTDAILVQEDITQFTEAGYCGRDLNEIFVKIFDTAAETTPALPNEDPKYWLQRVIHRAENAIIFLDEIDKITPSIYDKRDIRSGLQDELLKIMEGMTLSIEPKPGVIGGRRSNAYGVTTINTENMLFVVAGAFQELDKIIEKRVSCNSMGFTADIKTNSNAGIDALFEQVDPEDLIKYGLKAELVGRLPVIAVLRSLTVDELYDILTKVEASLYEQYQYLFGLFERELIFTEEALRKIAQMAYDKKVGGRGLRNIMEASTLEAQYTAPDDAGTYEPVFIEEKDVTD